VERVGPQVSLGPPGQNSGVSNTRWSELDFRVPGLVAADAGIAPWSKVGRSPRPLLALERREVSPRCELAIQRGAFLSYGGTESKLASMAKEESQLDVGADHVQRTH